MLDNIKNIWIEKSMRNVSVINFGCKEMCWRFCMKCVYVVKELGWDCGNLDLCYLKIKFFWDLDFVRVF